ncbi:MAG: hypothetical protein AB1782_15990 [Cyanobacteriota bacterium]
MRITPLNYSVNLLSKYWELNTARINVKAYSSIDQVTEAGVNQTSNVATTNVGATNPMYIDPSLALDMAEVYNALANPDDRLGILMLLNKPELMNLLFLLDKEKLLLGLNFFSMPKLLELLLRLPKELLLQALLMFMNIDELLSIMPQRELLRILSSSKVKESMLLKAIENLPTHILIAMLEAVLGESVGKLKHADVMKKMQHLKKRQILEGLLTLPSGTLQQICAQFCKMDPSLLMEMSKGAISKPFTRFQKSMLVESFRVVDSSEIIKLLGGLPKNLLAQVACMIDPGDLAQALSNHFPNIIAMMAGA